MISAQWARVQDRATQCSSLEFRANPAKALLFLMLLPDRGPFPLTPGPSHRVLFWLIKLMRETKAMTE